MVQYKGGGGGGSVTRRWSREGGHSPTLQGMDKLAYFSARHKNYPFGQLFFEKFLQIAEVFGTQRKMPPCTGLPDTAGVGLYFIWQVG